MAPSPRRAPTRTCNGLSRAGRLGATLAAALLCGCASTAPGGRAQLTAPTPVSSIYSSIGMGLELASVPVAAACVGLQCRVNEGFEKQVSRLGIRLAHAAFELYPDLKERVAEFDFSVADKSEAGSTSDAGGAVIIYRGVRCQGLDETGLAYLIGREMGHVIARHHEEKPAIAVLTSVLAQILLPTAGLAPGLAFLATSAVSAAGTEVVSAGGRQDRRQEADIIALGLLARQGWSEAEVAVSLAGYAGALGDDPWSLAVKESVARLEKPGQQAMVAAAAS